MRRLQKIVLTLAPFLALLLFADPALALAHGGTGIYGNTNDGQITNTMFFLLGFFPFVILVFSLIQMWTEKRRHRKLEAVRIERAAEQQQGGW